jgi:hypothetical protein
MLLGLFAAFWAWGAVSATIEQQEHLGHFLRELVRRAPELPSLLGHYASFFLSGLLQ